MRAWIITSFEQLQYILFIAIIAGGGWAGGYHAGLAGLPGWLGAIAGILAGTLAGVWFTGMMLLLVDIDRKLTVLVGLEEDAVIRFSTRPESRLRPGARIL